MLTSLMLACSAEKNKENADGNLNMDSGSEESITSSYLNPDLVYSEKFAKKSKVTVDELN